MQPGVKGKRPLALADWSTCRKEGFVLADLLIFQQTPEI